MDSPKKTVSTNEKKMALFYHKGYLEIPSPTLSSFTAICSGTLLQRPKAQYNLESNIFQKKQCARIRATKISIRPYFHLTQTNLYLPFSNAPLPL